MPDNSAAIAEIRATLASGARSVTVDGVSTTIDPDSLRRELSRLEDEDSTARLTRPRSAQVYLGGF